MYLRNTFTILVKSVSASHSAVTAAATIATAAAWLLWKKGKTLLGMLRDFQERWDRDKVGAFTSLSFAFATFSFSSFSFAHS